MKSLSRRERPSTSLRAGIARRGRNVMKGLFSAVFADSARDIYCIAGSGNALAESAERAEVTDDHV